MKLRGRAVESAIVGIYTLLLLGTVVAILVLAREICIPIALAALLTFLLAPLVTRLERWVGRMAAVLLAVAVVAGGFVVVGYVVGHQIMDLTVRLPDYQTNIQAKLRAIRLPDDGTFTRLSRAIEELRHDIPEQQSTPTIEDDGGGRTAVPVRVIDDSGLADNARAFVGPIIGGLAMAGIVLLLTIFMLLHREDLRGRLIRLIGQGHISATTHAMADAGQRVSRYLLMQLVVNVAYGIPVAIGLYVIGVPNAMLWGALSAVLRFIPYAGPWIAAAAPIALSLAVSDGWTMPLATIGLFIVLEIISNNIMEPWLYGSSTGVSSLALILASILWAWLWGPIGLVLSTPLTVCLVVLGRHVPRLAFFSVLLSDEQPLAPHQECYHRLLRADLTEATALVDTYLKSNSLTALYDQVLIPVVASAEADHGQDALSAEQRTALQQGVRDILQELSERPVTTATDPHAAEAAATLPPAPTCRVLCLPVRAMRDELAAAMLEHALARQGFAVDTLSSRLTTIELIEQVEQHSPEAVCISVVAPSAIVHARHLCSRLRARLPDLTIVVGLWGASESTAAAAATLSASGADAVVASVADAVVHLGTLSATLTVDMAPPPMPADEEARLAALIDLALIDGGAEPAFDRIVVKLARIFDVPTAMLTLVDAEREIFKAHTGLPPALAEAGSAPRATSLCGYVVAADEALIVPDLARDVRFARSHWLVEYGLRFYAGLPIRTTEGRAIGALCIMDTKPRRLSERDQRLLALIADEVGDLLKARGGATAVH